MNDAFNLYTSACGVKDTAMISDITACYFIGCMERIFSVIELEVKRDFLNRIKD